MFAYAKPKQKQANKNTVQKKKTENSVSKNNMSSHHENSLAFSFSGGMERYNSDKPTQLRGKNNDVIPEVSVKNKMALIQRKRVEDDRIAGDLVHPEVNRLFDRSTIRWKNDLPPTTLNNHARLTDTVKSNRSRISYERLRDSTLVNKKGLINWLKESGEHMYVHVGSIIHIATRNDEKLPHPTLVGGNPDAKGAGTMNFEESSTFGSPTIEVTNLSGHFKPTRVNRDTSEKIEDILDGKGNVIEKNVK